MGLGFIVFCRDIVSGYDVAALVRDLKIATTRRLSVATAGVYTEQLVGIDHDGFPVVDYIELPHLLKAETRRSCTCKDMDTIGRSSHP